SASGSSGSSGSSGGESSGSTSAGTSAGSTSAGTTGGLGESCEDLGEVDFGECAAIVGWIFDGEGCKLVSGCGCEPHCDAVFAGPGACASTCAAAGACNTSLLQGAGIFKGPFELGVYCDDVDVCTDDPVALAEVFPGVSCDGAVYPCDPDSLCQVGDNGMVTAEAWESYCAASLLPGVSGVKCLVLGP
ncbi:MAG TPA: hypothetical protein PKW35_06165, partial [Nannocystaceae bacterium]|nr:hypothetical protein [Nannocystaceae bacterium]